MAYKFMELGVGYLPWIEELGYIIKMIGPYTDPEYVLSDDGTYYICKGVEDSDLKVTMILRKNTIQSSIDGIPVTHIGNNAFRYSYFTDFIVPEGIISIGDNAFEKSYTLKNIVLPNSLVTIGDSAFYASYLNSILCQLP